VEFKNIIIIRFMSIVSFVRQRCSEKNVLHFLEHSHLTEDYAMTFQLT
jgi:hypothetical protein